MHHVVSMSDLPVEIVKLLSVNLTLEKQMLLEHDFKTYADASNFAIKTILKRNIPNRTRAEEMLHDDIISQFMLRKKDASGIDGLEEFGRRFKYNLVIDYTPQRIKIPTEHGLQERDRTPEEVRQDFVNRYSQQYVKDILRTAGAEISAHRKLAKTLISARGKIPYFKEGTMILSGMLVEVGERVVEILSLTGEKIPIPFDKRSRNREPELLSELSKGRRKYQRVRLTLNKAGYLNIDIRMPRN